LVGAGCLVGVGGCGFVRHAAVAKFPQIGGGSGQASKLTSRGEQPLREGAESRLITGIHGKGQGGLVAAAKVVFGGELYLVDRHKGGGIDEGVSGCRLRNGRRAIVEVHR